MNKTRHLFQAVGRFTLILSLVSLTFWQIQLKVWPTDTAKAGSLTSITASPATVAASTAYSPTVTFTTASTIPAGGSVGLSFIYNGQPSGNGTQFSVDAASLNSASPASFSLGFASNGYIMLAATAEVTAQAITLTLSGLTSPSVSGPYFINVTTSNAQGTLIDGDQGGNGMPTSITNMIKVGTVAIQGTLLQSDGATPMSGAFVSLNDANYAYISGSQTQADGSFAFFSGSVSAGSYQLMTFLEGSNSNSNQVAPDPVTVTYSGSTVTQNLRMNAATKTISGNVKYSDGAPVTSGSVNIFGMEKPVWRQVNISNGSYSAAVSGGNYGIEPQNDPNSSRPWAYTGEFQQTSFQNDNSAESTTINLTVTEAKAQIKGVLLDPDGNRVDGRTIRGSLGLVPANTKGQGGGGGSIQIQENGSFSSWQPAGVYTLALWMDPSDTTKPWFLLPAKITLNDNVTTNLSNISLKKKTGRIGGKVTDTDTGGVIANVFVGSFSMEAEDFSMAKTGSDGRYGMLVPEGYKRGVMAMQDGGPGGESAPEVPYVQLGGPQFVDVPIGGPWPGVDLKMKKADSTVKVLPVDSHGNVVNNLYGYIDFSNDADGKGREMFTGVGGPFGGSQVSAIRVPSGTYQTVSMMIAPGSSYTPDKPSRNVNIPPNTANHQLRYSVFNNNATIDIYPKDENGNAVTNFSFEGCATNPYGVMAFGDYNSQNSRVRVNVASQVGPWTVCASSNDENKVIRLPENATVAFNNDRASLNVTVLDANAVITGSIGDGKGHRQEGAYVSISNRGADLLTAPDRFFMQRGNISDTNGNYSAKVPSGTYKVSAYLPAEKATALGLINPAPIEINVGKNSTTKINLDFRSSDHQFKGTVKDNNGNVVANALVSGYSTDGARTETKTDKTGVYTLLATKNATWTVEAVKDAENDVLATTPIITETSGGQTSLDITLTRDSNRLANSTSKSSAATNTIAANTTNGSVTFPANSLSSSGNATVTVTPTKEVESDRDNQVVGVALDISAIAGSSAVTQLNSNASIQINYNDSDIPQGTTESRLVLAYKDENAGGTWIPLDSYSIDSNNNTVIGTTSHLTTFALVTATDTIPPAAPTNVKASDAATGGRVTLTWTNPTDVDFNHVDVYQSTTSGQLGSRVASTVSASTSSLTVSNLTDGTAYYFSLKAVDTTANASTASEQVTATSSASGTSLPKTGRDSATNSYLIFGLITISALAGILLRVKHGQ